MSIRRRFPQLEQAAPAPPPQPQLPPEEEEGPPPDDQLPPEGGDPAQQPGGTPPDQPPAQMPPGGPPPEMPPGQPGPMPPDQAGGQPPPPDQQGLPLPPGGVPPGGAPPSQGPPPVPTVFKNDGTDKLDGGGNPKTLGNAQDQQPVDQVLRQPGPGDRIAIMRWLKENPKATDQDLHMFLRSLGVNPAAGEQVVMDMARGNDAPGSPKPSPKQAATDRKPPPTPAVGKPDLRQEQVSSNHRMDGRRRFNSNPNHLPSRFEEDSAVKPGRAKPQRRRFARIKGGQGDDLEPDQVDPRELKLGIEVEMEHTKSRSLAQEIALGHLAESPNYYSRLKKIHKD